jgi:hypothetical protein
MNTDRTKSASTLPLQESGSSPSFGFGDLFKFLYNANPFYLISACLILYAQTVIFDTGNIWMETAIPLGLITTYTVLLTATAIFIVRRGSVWDDARSILLIILSLFVVLSSSIDAKTLDSPVAGAAWLGGGLCFSIVIAESLRMGLRLFLPLRFRAVFYTMIGIFFAYPFVMAQLVNSSSDSQLPTIRGIILFPIVCGLALLPLIPVIRRGPSYLAANGTPWQWPMFPWSIFGLLTLGACCRTYLLSLSFYGGRGSGPFSHMETGFSLYMLIPLALASMILLLEFALERGEPRQIALFLAAPFLFLLMVSPGPTRMNEELYHKFLATAVGSNGSPILIALAGMLIFYVYAWYRSVKHSETILCGVLLLSQVMDVRSHWLSNSHIPTWIPGVAALAILVWIAVRKNSTASWMAFVLGALLVTGTEFRDSQFTAWHGAIPAHIALASAILLGFLRNDLFAVALRYISAAVITLLFVTVLFFGDELSRGLPEYLLAAYLAVLFAVLTWYCLRYRRAWFLVMGGFNATMLLLFTAGKAYNATKALGFKALNVIFWALACFAIAFLISAIKGNLFQMVFLKLKSRWEDKG